MSSVALTSSSCRGSVETRQHSRGATVGADRNMRLCAPTSEYKGRIVLRAYARTRIEEARTTVTNIEVHFCQDSRMLSTRPRTACSRFCSHSIAECCKTGPPEGWSKKCQHILHLTFLALGSSPRLLVFVLGWSLRLLGNLDRRRQNRTEQTCKLDMLVPANGL